MDLAPGEAPAAFLASLCDKMADLEGPCHAPPVPQSRVGHGALDSIDSDTALWTRPGTYRKEWLPADDPVPVSSIARRVRV